VKRYLGTCHEMGGGLEVNFTKNILNELSKNYTIADMNIIS